MYCCMLGWMNWTNVRGAHLDDERASNFLRGVLGTKALTEATMRATITADFMVSGKEEQVELSTWWVSIRSLQGGAGAD